MRVITQKWAACGIKTATRQSWFADLKRALKSQCGCVILVTEPVLLFVSYVSTLQLAALFSNVL